jgi:ABC-type antimicrobial peptide transport system permease subunit
MQPGGEPRYVTSARVGRNYFETFRQPLIAGRLFTPAEIASSANVAVVDETFVRLMLEGRNAIGQQVRDKGFGPWLEIVGVVRDISLAPKKTTQNATIYVPVAAAGKWSMRIIVHSRSRDGVARLQAAAAATEPQMRFTDLMTVQQLAASDAQTLRFFASSLAIVSAIAVMLSAAGIYSLIAFTLARRTREIGIRTALGAAPLSIMGRLVSRAFLQAGIGIVLGSIPGALLLRQGTEGSSGLGSWAVAAATLAVAVFVAAVAFACCITPVRRALKIPPTDALRTT